LLKGQTVGVIGAGRIGSAYARMMIEGFKMNLIYYDLYQATRLEKFVTGKHIYWPSCLPCCPASICL
jgi:glycerate dehydrogenase